MYHAWYENNTLVYLNAYLGHAVDLLQSCPEKITLYMGGPPYKVLIIVILKNSHHTCVGPHYKVPIIDIIHVRGPHYKVSIIAILKKAHCWGTPITRFPSLRVTRFPHSNHIVHVGGPHCEVPTFHIRYEGTIRVIDSYKVPTVACPCPWGLGALIISIYILRIIMPLTRSVHADICICGPP